MQPLLRALLTLLIDFLLLLRALRSRQRSQLTGFLLAQRALLTLLAAQLLARWRGRYGGRRRGVADRWRRCSGSCIGPRMIDDAWSGLTRWNCSPLRSLSLWRGLALRRGLALWRGLALRCSLTLRWSLPLRRGLLLRRGARCRGWTPALRGGLATRRAIKIFKAAMARRVSCFGVQGEPIDPPLYSRRHLVTWRKLCQPSKPSQLMPVLDEPYR